MSNGIHRRTIVALVHDKPGVLARISGLFRRRGDREYLDFMEENEDALFYANKIKTTRYFVDGIIPQFDALLAGVKKQNYEALGITF